MLTYQILRVPAGHGAPRWGAPVAWAVRFVPKLFLFEALVPKAKPIPVVRINTARDRSQSSIFPAVSRLNKAIFSAAAHVGSET